MYRLQKNPKLHDKIEFNLAITCFSFDFKKITQLMPPGLSSEEIKKITKSYLELTKNCFIENSKYSLKYSFAKIEKLKSLQAESGDKSIKILLNECRNFGTLYFAILARHGFIATTLLRSLNNINIISDARVNLFLNNISTVATEMIDDHNKININKKHKKFFLKKYGHLRPGTYDINSKRYDQTNKYFVKDITKNKIKNKENLFKIKNLEKVKIDKLINKYNLGFKDTEGLFSYIKEAIKLREYSKFVFTKSISNILEKIAKISSEKNITRDEASYFEIDDFTNKFKTIKKIFNNRKLMKNNDIINSVKLPQIIFDESSSFITPFQNNIPNFVTRKKIIGEIVYVDASNSMNKNLKNKIVIIENADPGYDWIFSHKIKGLITKYGGSNSHMSIRCSEFSLPAAIGCGEKLFNNIKNNKKIFLDCSLKNINLLG